ncbi:MAG: hypothetical protein RBJ76_09200 [Stenomitos frigidus ULC029]
MSVQPKSLNQMTQDAIAILIKEMGIANTLRFLNQFSTGYGDYTDERAARFKDLTLAELLQQMREQQ